MNSNYELDPYLMMLYLSVKFEWNWCIPSKVIEWKPKLWQCGLRLQRRHDPYVLTMLRRQHRNDVKEKWNLDTYFTSLYICVQNSVKWLRFHALLCSLYLQQPSDQKAQTSEKNANSLLQSERGSFVPLESMGFILNKIYHHWDEQTEYFQGRSVGLKIQFRGA